MRSGRRRHSRLPEALDAIQFLKREHNGLKRLFTDLRRTAPRAHRKRRGLLDRIVTDLEVHARIEEELFYPAIGELPSTRHIVVEARADHDTVREVVSELEALAPTDRGFVQKADELREIALAHILDEEDDIFPIARRLGDERLEDLGVALLARRRQLGERGAPIAGSTAA